MVKSKYQEVSIRVTDACDLSCSFCINGRGTSMLKSNREKLLDVLRRNNFVESPIWSIVGGEPLLEWETTKEILFVLCDDVYSVGDDRKVSIMTNGTHLNQEIFELCMDMRVHLDISTGGSLSNEKPLSLLMNNPFIRDNPGIFEFMPSKGRGAVSMTMVVDPNDEWAPRAYMLMKIFGVNVNVALDVYKLGLMTDRSIDNIEAQLEWLDKQRYGRLPHQVPEVGIKRMSRHHCNGDGLFYAPDGSFVECSTTFFTNKHIDEYKRGCKETVSLMGVHNFDKLSRIVNAYKEGGKYE